MLTFACLFICLFRTLRFKRIVFDQPVAVSRAYHLVWFFLLAGKLNESAIRAPNELAISFARFVAVAVVGGVDELSFKVFS